MPSLTDIREYVTVTISTVRDAPGAFITAAFVLTLIIWVIFSWWHGAILEQKDATMKKIKDEFSHYHSKLHNETAYQVAKKIENLEQKIAELQSSPEHNIYDKFLSIVNTNPSLGKPLDESKTSDVVLQAWYEKAVVICINSLSRFLVLTNLGTVQERSDPRWDKDPKWFNDDELIQIFGKPPPGRHPPNGGIAYHWKEYGWGSTLGWRVEECWFGANAIRYQQFQKGIIIGPLLKGPNIKAGQEIVVVGDKWFPVTSSQDLPKYVCD
jgi:hypothetical protein